MHVTDLARAVAPESAWNVIGMHPGEKLHDDNFQYFFNTIKILLKHHYDIIKILLQI